MKQDSIADTSSSEVSAATRTELFNRYVLPHKNLIYALCIRYTFRREDIADNYNEVLVNFFRYIHTYKPERSIQTWLYIVTKRYIYDLNVRHRLPSTDDVSVYDLPAGPLIEEDTHTNSMGMDNYREFYNDDILWALKQLKPIYRETLLYKQAGYKHHEIMEITFRNGTLKTRNIETVKSRLLLAKQQLRKLITRDGERKSHSNLQPVLHAPRASDAMTRIPVPRRKSGRASRDEIYRGSQTLRGHHTRTSLL